MPPISSTSVSNLLFGIFSQYVPPGELQARTVIADDEYLPVPLDMVMASITSDPILAPERYRRNVFDCDDYVMHMKTKLGLFAQTNKLIAPLAFGFILTTVHAYNFGLDPSGTIFIVNTQSSDRPVQTDPNLFGVFLNLSNKNIVRLIYI